MKLYSVLEPHRLDPEIIVQIVMDENEILNFYWDTWKANMIKAGKPKEMITESNCIEDWAIVNWAVEFNDYDDLGDVAAYGMVRMDYDMWKDYDKRMKAYENN